MRKNHFVTSLALLPLVGCGDNLPDPDAEPSEPVAGRTLTGSDVVSFRSLDKTLLGSRPNDLWSTVVEAHVPDGNGWSIRAGTGHRDGSFTIGDVPDGHVWLRTGRRPFGDTYYWTSADHISFDEDVLGPEWPETADDGDELLLAVDGLAPWQATDELAYFVPEDIVLSQNLVGWPPPELDTTDLTGTAVDWTGRSLANVAAGEPAFVIQYREQTVADGLTLKMPLRSAQPTIAQSAGTNATLDVTLAAPPSLTYHLAWARDVFEAERPNIHPTRAGASIAHGWSMSAVPSIIDGEIWLGVEYPVAFLTDWTVVEGTTPLDLGTFAIPNPFPQAWLTDMHVVTFPIDMPLPDGNPQTLEAVIGARRTDVTRTDPVVPTITPARAPQLNGDNAFARLEGVGRTPVLSWTAPSTGTATAYRIQIVQAYTTPPEPYRPGWYIVSELMVPGDVTSIRLPADVLVEGETYAMVIRAFAQPGQDVETRPFAQQAAAGFADTIVGPFSP